MLLNKILFVLNRCNYNDDKTSLFNLKVFKSFKNVIFEILSNRILISSVIRNFILLSLFIVSLFLQTVENNFNIDDFSNSNTSKIINDSLLNIYKIVISIYYNLVRKKNYKLFILTITSKASLITNLRLFKIYLRNKTYLYKLDIKYKRYYNNSSYLNLLYELEILLIIFYIQIEIFTFDQIKEKLFAKYYNFANVFNRIKINKLLFYRAYNYKINLINEKIKIKFSRNRIYSLFIYKLKQIKKYLNKNLRKDFIIFN